MIISVFDFDLKCSGWDLFLFVNEFFVSLWVWLVWCGSMRFPWKHALYNILYCELSLVRVHWVLKCRSLSSHWHLSSVWLPTTNINQFFMDFFSPCICFLDNIFVCISKFYCPWLYLWTFFSFLLRNGYLIFFLKRMCSVMLINIKVDLDWMMVKLSKDWCTRQCM